MTINRGVILAPALGSLQQANAEAILHSCAAPETSSLLIQVQP